LTSIIEKCLDPIIVNTNDPSKFSSYYRSFLLSILKRFARFLHKL